MLGRWFNRKNDHYNKRQIFGTRVSSYNHEDGQYSMILDNEAVPYSNLWYGIMIVLYVC